MRYALLVLTAILLAACGESGSTVESIPDADMVASPDNRLETPDIPDAAGIDGAPDVFELTLPDTSSDLPFEGCTPGDGCFLDPCTDNAQCQSGWCVEHMGDSVCSLLCQEECPPGWGCKPVGTGGPDLTYICVSNHSNLCKPCRDSQDCKAVGGADDVCVDYADQGAFCGGKCQADEDCPWGFSCVDTQTVDGIATQQCIADAGVCPCTEKSVELALWTACSATNEYGTCAGKRVCTEDGLSPCDAAMPAEETCNGIDDNCDGDTDEATCDDSNPCTFDECLGDDGCVHTALDEGECIDGNPCTVADHCLAGECTGTPVLCDDENPCTDDSCDETGGCVFTPNTAKCDDSDPCTVADECDSGVCAGYAVDCQCTVDADCTALEDGDLCNGTLLCDTSALPHLCVLDPDTIVTCPAPDGPDAFCLTATCDPLTAECSIVPHNEGFACDDGNPCTIGEQCLEGMCAGGVPPNCNDGNPCTDDACAPDQGCVHTNNAAPCNDGNSCTTGDGCLDGNCSGAGNLDCDDSNPCTDDSCDPDVGCVHTANDSPCNDNNACTSGDHCAGGVCVFDAGLDCDDDNLCTTDKCDPATGCQHTLNQAPCDDANVCTTGDHCHLGECIAGGQLTCNDSNPCTDDSCKPESGCSFVPNAQPCDDANACTTVDVCAGGACKGTAPPDCDDANPCTTDSCDPDAGCVNAPNTLACDDGDACTAGDSCAAGECVPGAPLGCDDDNPCTDDSCDPATGCVHVPNADPCDDGNACTSDDACVNAECDGQPLVCNDSDSCTDDSCDPATGCVYEPIIPCCGNGEVEAGEQCDDGNHVGGDGCEADCTSPTVCSQVAIAHCLARGWHHVDAYDGNIVCTKNGQSSNNNCDACSIYNIYVWKNGSKEKHCTGSSYSTQAGHRYSAHTPCSCGDNLDDCGTWDMQGCIPD